MGQTAVGQNTRAIAANAVAASAAVRYVSVGIAITVLTLLTFVQFPGRTFLESDTQIYVPILEHFRDPSVFTRELLARHPHTSFTIYDESTLALSRATGLELEDVLVAQQFVFRALGILGVFLLARALLLSRRLSLLVAAAFSLGATIAGPTVLSIEYEPVPRGFAIPLLLLAIGLAANGRDIAAGFSASVAFLYHPPSVIPFWMVYFCLTLWPSKPDAMRRRIWGLIPILAGVFALFVLSRMQTGVIDPLSVFDRIDPELERLQRLRAPYNWVSMWQPMWFLHYAFLWAVSLVAFRRLGKSALEDVRFFLIGLPLIGVLSVPAGWLLLDKWKWILAPQIQPARTILFVTVLAGVLASVAAVKAGEQRRWWECALWFALVFAIPINTYVPGSITGLGTSLGGRRAALVLGLALVATAAVWTETQHRRWASAPWAAAVLLPFFLIPSVGEVINYPHRDTRELDALASWARSATPKDSVFLFPDAGRDFYPGIFRSRALRALYVDWKAGGQVNFLREFGIEWWNRWQAAGAGKFIPARVAEYPAMGIDYFVLKPAHKLTNRMPVYENSQFVVYKP